MDALFDLASAWLVPSMEFERPDNRIYSLDIQYLPVDVSGLWIFFRSFLVYSCFFLVLRYPLLQVVYGKTAASVSTPAQKAEYCSYIVSYIQALYAAYGGFECMLDGGDGFSNPHETAFGISETRNYYILVMAGYLFYGKWRVVFVFAFVPF